MFFLGEAVNVHADYLSWARISSIDLCVAQKRMRSWTWSLMCILVHYMTDQLLHVSLNNSEQSVSTHQSILLNFYPPFEPHLLSCDAVKRATPTLYVYSLTHLHLAFHWWRWWWSFFLPFLLVFTRLLVKHGTALMDSSHGSLISS